MDAAQVLQSNAGVASRRRTRERDDEAIRAVLGASGVTAQGRIGYAFCEREGLYHYDRTDRTARIAPATNVRLSWTPNTAQPARAVGTRSVFGYVSTDYRIARAARHARTRLLQAEGVGI